MNTKSTSSKTPPTPLFRESFEQAFVQVTQELNDALVAFDTWLSQNADQVNVANDEFKRHRQTIKFLQMRQQEYKTQQQLQEQDDHTLLKLENVFTKTPQYARDRCMRPVGDKRQPSLGQRTSVRVSKK